MDLITGANGFIGFHLLKALLDKKKEVGVLIFKSRNRLEPLLKNKNVKVIYGDLTDINSLKKATQGIDTIYHLAAYIGGAQPKEELFNLVNVKGTENLFRAAKENNVKKFVIISSVTVLGECKNGNENTPFAPETAYGRSKVKVEKLCQKFHDEYGMNFIILRPCQIYGPGETGSFYNIVNAIKNKRFLIIGDGKNTMNFLYIDDLIKVLIKSGELLTSKRTNFEKFVISSEPISLDKLSKTVAQAGGIKNPDKIPYIIGYLLAILFESISFVLKKKVPINRNRLKAMISNRSFDCNKAKKMFGFKQEVGFEEGVKRYIQWFEKYV